MISFKECPYINRPSARFCGGCGESLTSPPPETTTKISKVREQINEYIFGFPPSLRPEDIAKCLKDEMEKQRVPFPTKIIVPNCYKVKLSSEDYNRFKGFGDRLEELSEELEHLAKQKGYRLRGEITIEFIRSHHIMCHPTVESKGEGQKNRRNQKVLAYDSSRVPLSTVSWLPKMPLLKVLDQIEEQFLIMEDKIRFFFGGTVDPVDIFKKRKYNLYKNENNLIIPDVYEVRLSEQDYHYLKSIEKRLDVDVEQELSSDLEDFAKRRGYMWLGGRIKITLKSSLFQRKLSVKSGSITIKTRKLSLGQQTFP